jgi:Helix-turn-helix domain
MEVICINTEAFHLLVQEVVDKVKAKQNIQTDKWLSCEEAMSKLRISSKTTLQKLRDTGAIRFSNPAKKLILYDVDSINSYLEKHAKNTF